MTRARLLTLLIALAAPLYGCHEPGGSPEPPAAEATTAPATATTQPAEPAPAPADAGPPQTPPSPGDASRTPKRPEPTPWLILRDVFDEKADASWSHRWLGANKIEIKTRNIERITIDMTHPPSGAPSEGPWTFIIDDQGVEMTGFKPRAGYTGKIRDLVRSPNGQWTFDRKKLYRPHP